MAGSFSSPLVEQSPEMTEQVDLGTAHLNCSGRACGLVLLVPVLAKQLVGLELVWSHVCPYVCTFFSV